jgi:uncharacterized protein DUF5658
MIPARLTLAIFIVFQLADGLITYTAVDFFGPHAEANPLVATWIALAGAGPALLGAKLVACGCGLVLYRYGTHKVLAGLTIIYLVGAVGPWLHQLTVLAP